MAVKEIKLRSMADLSINKVPFCYFDEGDLQVISELFNDWGGRGYDDSVPAEVTKTVPSGDRTS